MKWMVIIFVSIGLMGTMGATDLDRSGGAHLTLTITPSLAVTVAYQRWGSG